VQVFSFSTFLDGCVYSQDSNLFSHLHFLLFPAGFSKCYSFCVVRASVSTSYLSICVRGKTPFYSYCYCVFVGEDGGTGGSYEV